MKSVLEKTFFYLSLISKILKPSPESKNFRKSTKKNPFTPLPKELKAIQKTKLLIPRNTPPPLSLEDQHSLLLKILNTFSKSRDLLVLCEEGLGHLIDTSLIYQSTLFLWEEDHKKLIPQATRYAEAEKVEDIPLESGRLEKALEENQISLQETRTRRAFDFGSYSFKFTEF
jgi:hypothetical protein